MTICALRNQVGLHLLKLHQGYHTLGRRHGPLLDVGIIIVGDGDDSALSVEDDDDDDDYYYYYYCCMRLAWVFIVESGVSVLVRLLGTVSYEVSSFRR